MSKSIAPKNKAIVLEAFETLFNKRDYAAAERFWSPNYIQHSAHIAPGRDGLFGLVKIYLLITWGRRLGEHRRWSQSGHNNWATFAKAGTAVSELPLIRNFRVLRD